jgi:hypothetical protein
MTSDARGGYMPRVYVFRRATGMRETLDAHQKKRLRVSNV